MAASVPQGPDPSAGPVTPGTGPPSGPERQRTPEPVPARSRLGGLWIYLTSGAVVLVLLLVFVLQNGQHVQIHLYGGHWDAPLGVAVLMAAALGVLLVVVPGAGRIIQLRRTARQLEQARVRLLQQVVQPPAAPPPATPPRQPGVGEAPDAGEQR